MNVSSVKNLNGNTFSAVQDWELTNVVQTNSASWSTPGGNPEVESYVVSNSATIDDVNTTYQNASGTYLTALNIPESADWNESTNYVQTNSGAIDETVDAVETNSASWGAGSTPTYDYNDNLISAIDTSGLYAVSANAVSDHGMLGYDLSSYLSQNTSYFYWMPSKSPWTTGDYATGIFSPLQYATGACLAMNNPATFKAYYKGNEWYVSNTNIGQMLRGEVHNSRGVHISGATTAGYSFDLSIKNVNGVNSTGSWKYGIDEDTALRTVSALEYLQGTVATSAGIVGDGSTQNPLRLDDTVLWSGNYSISANPTFSISDSFDNYERVKIYMRGYPTHNAQLAAEWTPDNATEHQLWGIVPAGGANGAALRFNQFAISANDTTCTVYSARQFSLQGTAASTAASPTQIIKIVGCNRKA